MVGSDVFQISYTGGDGNEVALTSVKADVWTVRITVPAAATTGATR